VCGRVDFRNNDEVPAEGGLPHRDSTAATLRVRACRIEPEPKCLKVLIVGRKSTKSKSIVRLECKFAVRRKERCGAAGRNS
jgi:hypothetical protein